MKLKVLITGFEPFGKHKENPSKVILDGKYQPPHENIEFKKVVLTNVFSVLQPKYLKILDDYQPNLIINCGLDSKIYTIRIEKVALNLAFDHINEREFQSIDVINPKAFFSNVNVLKLANYLCKKGVPTEASFHAGIYSCNFILYNSLEWCTRNGGNAIFVHLPYTHEIASKTLLDEGVCKPSLSKTLMEKGLNGIISYFLEKEENYV